MARGRSVPPGGSRAKSSKYRPPGPGAYDVSAAAQLRYRDNGGTSFGGNLSRVDRVRTGVLMGLHRRKDDPGPGAYGTHSSIGAQKESRKPSSPAPRIGSSSRDAFAKVYDRDTYQQGVPNKTTPGPGAYSAVSPDVLASKAPAPSFGGQMAAVKRLETGTLASAYRNKNPGPGTYVVPHTIGDGADYRHRSSPRPKFSSGPRDDKSLKPDLPMTGGLGDSPGLKYAHKYDASGKQPTSSLRSAPRFSFGDRKIGELLYVTPGGTLIHGTKTSGGEATEASADVVKSFGAESRRPRSPAFGFGREKRFNMKEATASPGPVYDVKRELEGAPKFSFPKGARESVELRREKRKAVPGPGAYNNHEVGSAVGQQVLSVRPNPGNPKMGSSRRDQYGCVYVARAFMEGNGDPNSGNLSRGVPGAGTYNPAHRAVRPASPQFTFGGKGVKRGSKVVVQGRAAPGLYRPLESMGKQPVSRARTAPTFTFGNSSRDSRARVSQPGVRPLAVDSLRTPAPTRYKVNDPALGKQVLSVRRSFTGPKFGGGASRDAGPKRTSTPGPGTYKRRDAAMGPQPLSTRRTYGGFSFGSGTRASLEVPIG